MTTAEGLDAAASVADVAAAAAIAGGPEAAIALKIVALGLRIGAALSAKGVDPVAELQALDAKIRADTEGGWRAAEERRWPSVPEPPGSSPR